MNWESIGEFLGTAAIIAGAVLLLALIIGLVNQCPRCKKLHAKTDLGSQQTNQQITARVENFSEPITNAKGETIGTNRWSEQRQYLITDYRHDHQCKFCDYRWFTTSQSETPNFTKGL